MSIEKYINKNSNKYNISDLDSNDFLYSLKTF